MYHVQNPPELSPLVLLQDIIQELLILQDFILYEISCFIYRIFMDSNIYTLQMTLGEGSSNYRRGILKMLYQFIQQYDRPIRSLRRKVNC